ncbi:uncharacterized protein LOC111127479 isoform X2 [Crassostrea virginica]
MLTGSAPYAILVAITAVVFTGLTVFKSSSPGNTTKTGPEEENHKRPNPSDTMETGQKRSTPPFIDEAKMQEYVKLMLREEVQKEIKKHNIDSVVRSDVQKYQQGEVQGVLTPQLLEALIASSMEQMMDKFNEQLEEKIEYHLDKNIKKHSKKAETEIEMNERLKKIEEILLQKEMGSTFDALILVPIYKMKTSISVIICYICNFFKTVLDVIVHKVRNYLEKVMEFFGIYESDPIVLILPVFLCLFCSINNWWVMCLCYCSISLCLIVKPRGGSMKTFCNLVWKSGCYMVFYVIERYALSVRFEYLGFGILVIIGCIIIMQNRSKVLSVGGSKRKSIGRSKGGLIGGSIDDVKWSLNQSLEPVIEKQYKKLENSMCVVSYSIDYVEKYHVPLAKSLMEYSNRKDLRIKRAIIREPENLNSIPPSKIFIVFVDYNERNDLLEPVNPNAEQVPIRRETVRSLMDSMALVIFTYCMEQTSKRLPHGDRYAHKLSSKVLTIPELQELDEKKCVYSVYNSFNQYQLGIMKQIIEDYLKHF